MSSESLGETVYEYGEETTIHGVKELIRYHGIKKVLWLVCVSGCLAFGVYEIYKIAQSYRYGNVITKVTVGGVAPVQLFFGSAPKISSSKLTNSYIPSGVYQKGSGNRNVDLYLTGYSFDTVLLDLHGSQGWNDSKIIQDGIEYVGKFKSVEDTIFSIMPDISSRIENASNGEGWSKKVIQVGTANNKIATVHTIMTQREKLKGFTLKKDFNEDLHNLRHIGSRRPGYLISYPTIESVPAFYTIKLNQTSENDRVYISLMNTQWRHRFHFESKTHKHIVISMKKVNRLAGNCQSGFKTNIPLSKLAQQYRKAVRDQWQLERKSSDVENPHFLYNSWKLGLRNKNNRALVRRLLAEYSGRGPKVYTCHTCNLCEEYVVDWRISRDTQKYAHGQFSVSFKSATATIMFEEVNQFTIDGTIANVGGLIGVCCGLSLISIWHCIFYWSSKIRSKIKYI